MRILGLSLCDKKIKNAHFSFSTKENSDSLLNFFLIVQNQGDDTLGKIQRHNINLFCLFGKYRKPVLALVPKWGLGERKKRFNVG